MYISMYVWMYICECAYSYFLDFSEALKHRCLRYIKIPVQHSDVGCGSGDCGHGVNRGKVWW